MPNLLKLWDALGPKITNKHQHSRINFANYYLLLFKVFLVTKVSFPHIHRCGGIISQLTYQYLQKTELHFFRKHVPYTIIKYTPKFYVCPDNKSKRNKNIKNKNNCNKSKQVNICSKTRRWRGGHCSRKIYSISLVVPQDPFQLHIWCGPNTSV